MFEAFTRKGLDPEEGRRYIIGKTGMSPAIYDDSTHYGVNQKLTLEMLKEISDSEDIIEVTGDYTGHIGAYGVSHEHTESARPRPAHDSRRKKAGQSCRGQKCSRKASHALAYMAAGIAGAIALAGFAISGGVPPNANVPAPGAGGPGALHGYIAGPEGLPAVGATVVVAAATDQSSGYTANSLYR